MAERGRRAVADGATDARVGRVTMAGNPLGVFVDGERRNLPIFAPNGYRWMPNVGDSVLVLKTDMGDCVLAGMQGESPANIGGVCITSAEGISLEGAVAVNGESLEGLIARIAQSVMPSDGGSDSE